MTKTVKTKSAPANSKKAAAARANSCTSQEEFWRNVAGKWQRIHGGITDAGVSVEWHDFVTASDLQWSRSFHSESLELCLNLEGCGAVHAGQKCLEFTPATAGFYFPGKRDLNALRAGGQRHRFLTVKFSRAFLRAQLAQCDGALTSQLEDFILGGENAANVGEIRRLADTQERLIAQMLQPPTVQGASSIWRQSLIMQLMAEFLFERPAEEELFCDRQKRLARERVLRTITLLRENLCKPPALEKIGRLVGCSPFYLSRTFSRETGMTLPQYVRKLRMERAGELLRSGKYNVTEAAMEVGYSSLSHFSQAFCQTMGCCPALYPPKTAA